MQHRMKVNARADLGLLLLPAFILFIKGTFHNIALLSFYPSPAAIHFNSALVKASWYRNRSGPSGASHLIIQFIRKQPPHPSLPPQV